ncbi:response regulator [Asticcacaulis solisilvae]|uniref:response regulator n=1 Tax=Asticcacaulis solisilvae TaxID=1217274 RepID=UPI003FD8A8C3
MPGQSPTPAMFGSVLVLDNDRPHAQHAARLLHEQRWTSSLTFNSATAIRTLQSTRYRMILVDSYIDGAHFRSFVDKLRTAAPTTPITAMMLRGQRGETAHDYLNFGADFVLLKPVESHGVKAVIADVSAWHRKRQRQHCVLVIEQDVELRAELCAVLAQVGYKVKAAANMEDAFFDHDLGAVNVIVTAVLIPGIGGIEGTRQVRKEFPHIHVVAMSRAVNDKITAEHVLAAAREAGAEETLAKPFTMISFLKAVEHVLQSEPRLVEAEEE